MKGKLRVGAEVKAVKLALHPQSRFMAELSAIDIPIAEIRVIRGKVACLREVGTSELKRVAAEGLEATPVKTPASGNN